MEKVPVGQGVSVRLGIARLGDCPPSGAVSAVTRSRTVVWRFTNSSEGSLEGHKVQSCRKRPQPLAGSARQLPSFCARNRAAERFPLLDDGDGSYSEEEANMKVRNVLSVAAVLCLMPALARAQEKKVTCADNTIVTSDVACANHGGVQKPGGLNKAGHELKKAALDVKDEAKRTPKNVETGAKTMGHNVTEAAGDVGSGAKKTAKKVGHG